MTPKDNIESTNRSKKKGDEGEDSEEETARLLTEDPLDLILKNEHVGNMLSVSKKAQQQNLTNVSKKLSMEFLPKKLSIPSIHTSQCESLTYVSGCSRS